MEHNYMQQQYKKMILFTILYGLFFTILLYDNFSGITMPIFISGSIVFFSKIFKKMGKNRKKILIFLEISLCLLGFSSFLSGNEIIHVLNVFAMIILFLTYLLLYYHDRSKLGYSGVDIQLYKNNIWNDSFLSKTTDGLFFQ
jgi:hypothetical protein